MSKTKKTFLYVFLAFLLIVFMAVFLSSELSSGLSFVEKKVFDDSAGKTEIQNTGRYIVVYNNKITDEDIKFLKAKDTKIKYKYTIINAVAIEFDKAKINEADLMNALIDVKKNKKIKAIVEDSLVQVSLWQSVPRIKANLTHAEGITGNGVKICVPDTGIDDTHPALKPLITEHDFVNNDSDAMDDNGHGTHVAGIIVSSDSYYKGVAPGADLMAAKVLDASGSGWTSDVIKGIEWCYNNNADIISLSLGGAVYTSGPPCDSDILAIAANNAVDSGVVVTAATGNDYYINAIRTPACASKVIAVGAVTKFDQRTAYSNEGAQLDIVAPGSYIWSTKFSGGFESMTGTSMATPHVSGTIALMLEKNPTLYPFEVMDILRNTSVDLVSGGCGVGFDTCYGYGRVDAYAAYLATPSCYGDRDSDGIADCYDLCPIDINKTSPGVCGCSVADTDSDNDTFYACIDDCDDNNPLINPGTLWYQDADNDTYGNAFSFLQQCIQPLNYVLDNTDCNDNNNAVWQLLNGYIDIDNDSYTIGSVQNICSGSTLPLGYTNIYNPEDCDDNNLLINPSASEIINDGIDNDCNSLTPVTTISGIGMNTPSAPKWRASMSILNVREDTLTGAINYYYTRQRVSFKSYSIISVNASGGIATIKGIGNATKIENEIATYCNACNFKAVIRDSNITGDAMSIEINEGFFYNSPGGLKTLDSGNFIVVGQ